MVGRRANRLGVGLETGMIDTGLKTSAGLGGQY